MRILVTGGTGFIGRALVSTLASRGDDVRVVSRRPGANPTVVGWDAVEGQVRQVDAVIHLAGEGIADARWSDARLERIRASRVETTATVAHAVARAAAEGKAPHVVVSASAIGIYGYRGGERTSADESAPSGDDVLARLCRAWEQAADPARAAGVRVVHPRIGVVLGHGGGMLAKLEPLFRWGLGGPVGSGRQWISWIHVKDVVDAIVFAVGQKSLEGPVNVVAPEPVTMDTFAQTLGRVLNRPAIVRVPSIAVRAAVGAGLAEVLLTGPRASAAKLAAAGFAFAFRSLEPALRDLVA